MTNEVIHSPGNPTTADHTKEALVDYPDRLSMATVGPSTSVASHETTTATGRLEADRPGDPHDEWGLYDPDCAGLPAILARIGAGLEPDDETARRRQALFLRLSIDEDE